MQVKKIDGIGKYLMSFVGLQFICHEKVEDALLQLMSYGRIRKKKNYQKNGKTK